MDYDKLVRLIEKNRLYCDSNDRKHCELSIEILNKVRNFIKENKDEVSFFRISLTSRVSNDIIYGGNEYNKLFLGVDCFNMDRKYSEELSKSAFKCFNNFTQLDWKYMEMSHGQQKKIDVQLNEESLLELSKHFLGERRCKELEVENLRKELTPIAETTKTKRAKL